VKQKPPGSGPKINVSTVPSLEEKCIRRVCGLAAAAVESSVCEIHIGAREFVCIFFYLNPPE
jgi:hypothetical protein